MNDSLGKQKNYDATGDVFFLTLWAINTFYRNFEIHYLHLKTNFVDFLIFSIMRLNPSLIFVVRQAIL